MAIPELVQRFDAELSSSIEAFTGERPELEYTQIRDQFVVRLKSTDQDLGIIPLQAQGHVVVGIRLDFKCSIQHDGRVLAIESSSISVLPYARGEREPLFRVEYVRQQSSDLPSSHFHIHAHRDEFTHLQNFAAKLSVEREKKVADYLKKPVTISSFHFPTGGPRFRPTLEDILEVLRVEFRLDVDKKRWQARLASSRMEWRRQQLAAAVRNWPEEALRVLVEECGMPMPEGWECPARDDAKLLRS